MSMDILLALKDILLATHVKVSDTNYFGVRHSALNRLRLKP
jgi:hypothetical protein